MSESMFAVTSTVLLIAFLFAWVPFLDSVVRLAALLKHRRAMEQMNLQFLFPEIER